MLYKKLQFSLKTFCVAFLVAIAYLMLLGAMFNEDIVGVSSTSYSEISIQYIVLMVSFHCLILAIWIGSVLLITSKYTTVFSAAIGGGLGLLAILPIALIYSSLSGSFWSGIWFAFYGVMHGIGISAGISLIVRGIKVWGTLLLIVYLCSFCSWWILS